MAANPASAGPQRSFTILASLALVIGFLYYASRVLIPVALAVLLTFILLPVVQWLQRQRVPRAAAAIAAVLLACLIIGGVGWLLTAELQSLAALLNQPEVLNNITAKIQSLEHGNGMLDELKKTWANISTQITKTIGNQDERAPTLVEIWSPTLSWFPSVLGPLVEYGATALLIAVLVVFMLVRREDLRNRIIRLVGKGQLTLTTRALDDAGQRISRFLLTQLLINTIFGTLLGIGLAVMGVHYAFLWGFLGLLLRFIPYVGTWIACVLPVALSVAVAPGWTQPLMVFGLFLVLELVTANVLEPMLLSHSTGVSPVALLVAVVFWTWLWGPIGLVLSTPLTTCLVVLGKFVRNLAFFDVLLGDEPVLETEVSYYQRLLAHDQDEATQLVEERLRTVGPEQVYDDVLLPALVLARRDRERGELTAEDAEFIFRATRDVLEEQVLPQQQIKQIATAAPGQANGSASPRGVILGLPAQSEADELALEMFRQLMEASNFEVEIGSARSLSSELLQWVEERHPVAVCIASVPPGGTAPARYLCKRLRTQFPELHIAVGRWGQTEDVERVRERLRAAGADEVATTLLETRDHILPWAQVQPAAAAADTHHAPEPAGRT